MQNIKQEAVHPQGDHRKHMGDQLEVTSSWFYLASGTLVSGVIGGIT